MTLRNLQKKRKDSFGILRLLIGSLYDVTVARTCGWPLDRSATTQRLRVAYQEIPSSHFYVDNKSGIFIGAQRMSKITMACQKLAKVLS